MNKQRKTSHILNVFQYDVDGHVVLPASLTLNVPPAGNDNSAKVTTTAWVRTYVSGLSYITGNQSITVSGDATGSGTTSIALTLANTAVTPGSYGSTTLVPVVTVDSKGRITSVTTAAISGSLTFTGDVTGTGTTGTSTAMTLAASGVTAGTYTKVTVDSKGRVTVGASATTSDISEGTNLYYTDARVLSYLSANTYATQSYVNTQVSNLVASAPATLDTLNELAAALGNDPSFATTISTALGNRLRVDINSQGLSATLQGYGRTNLGLGSLSTLSSIGDAYITDLAYSKLTGVPSTFAPSAHTHDDRYYTETEIGNFFSGASAITGYNKTNWDTAYGWGNHASGGYLTTASAASTYVSLSGSYANPSWITSLAYSKITGVPAFLTSYTETDPYRVTTVAVSGTSTKTITLTRADASTVTTTWTDYDTDTNTYVTSAGFSGGTLTLTRNDAGTVTVSLDGRYYLATNPSGYISSYTETDTLATVTGRGASTSTASIFSSSLAVGNSSHYDSAQFSLDVNGGVLIKNTGKTAQLILQNANPAAGGNNGFVQHLVGGTTTGAFASIQTYYGASVAAGTLQLQPNGGSVTIGGSTVYHGGNLPTIPTNNNQLTNGAGYITASALTPYLLKSGGTMTGTLTFASISGAAQTVPNTFGAYLHLGDWGVARTAAGAVLVNTAYRADYATDLLDMNISRFTNNSGYITSSSSISGNAATATYATNSSKLYSTDAAYSYTSGAPYYGYLTYDGTYWLYQVSPATPSAVRVARADTAGSATTAGNSATTSQRNFDGSLTSPDFYASGWFRNSGSTAGLYNSTHNTHFYASGTGQWNFATSNNSWIQIALRPASHESTVRGYIYADTNNNVGLLTNDGNWGLRVDVSKNVQIYGSVSATNLSGTNTGDQTNISGNAATATAAAGVSFLTQPNATWAGRLQLGGNGGGGAATVAVVQATNGNLHMDAGSGNHIYLNYYNNGIIYLNGGTYNISSNGSQYNGNSATATTAARATRANGNFYIDDNYGNSIIGVYSSTILQGVFAMGDAYKLTAGGGANNLYGLAWSHPNAGGQAANLSSHGLLVMVNGVTQAAISSNIWVAGQFNGSGAGLTGTASSLSIGGNATTAGGLAVHGGTNNEVNKIVRTDASGYIQAGWINSISGNMGFENRITRITCSDDQYMRFQALTEFKVSMGMSGKNNYSRRIDYTADANYHVGSFGHGGAEVGNIDRIFHYGSGFFDVWSGNGTYAPGTTHIHGFNVLHYTTGYGGTAYGWQMASQYNQTGLIYARWCSGGSFSAWQTIITSTNIGSQKADGSLKLWAASHPNDYYIVNNWTGTHWQLTSNHGSGVRVAYADSAGSATDSSKLPLSGGIMSGPISRNSHSTGFLEGSYNSVGGNSANTNPIYTIGSAYNPSDTALNSMYGIGYSHPNFWGAKTSSWGMYVCAGGTINATIGSGAVTIWAENDIVAFSDARVKDNIEVVTNAVEKIQAIRGVTFTRKDAKVEDKDKRHAGVIAQEVLKVMPEIVSGTEKDMYSVAYGNMAALFIEAIKEQQLQIDELKNKLDNVLSSR